MLNATAATAPSSSQSPAAPVRTARSSSSTSALLAATSNTAGRRIPARVPTRLDEVQLVAVKAVASAERHHHDEERHAHQRSGTGALGRGRARFGAYPSLRDSHPVHATTLVTVGRLRRTFLTAPLRSHLPAGVAPVEDPPASGGGTLGIIARSASRGPHPA